MSIFKLKEGMLAVMPVREDICRIVYTKRDEILEPSIMVEECANKEVVYSEEEHESEIVITTKKLKVTVDKATGVCCFRNPMTNKVYVKEAGKILTPTDVIHYSTEGEESVVNRVKTVDGERNFIENLKPYVDVLV